MRTLLRNLADTEAPPARIDIDRAVIQGRRRRRLRMAGAGGSALAAGFAVYAVFALVIVPLPPNATVPGGVLPSSASSGAPTGSYVSPDPADSGLALSTPPNPFNPLVPYASFGWLPQGYTTAAAGQASTSPDSTALIAESGSRELWLHVMAAGACSSSDSGSTLTCTYDAGDGSGPMPLTDRAPDVNGRRAYWSDFCNIIWEYAPDAWASIHYGCQGPAPASVRPMMSRVAAGVTYADRTPLRFPFWVSGMPAGWRVSATHFTDSPGTPTAGSMSFGPAAYPSAVQLSVTSASGSPGCMFIRSISRYVTVDGAKAILQAPNPSYHEYLCVNNVNGFMTGISLQKKIPGTGAAVPGVSGLGGAISIFKKIHVLGSDPAGWTTDPLR